MLPKNYSVIEFLIKLKKLNMYQDDIKLPLIPIRKGAAIYISISSGIDNIIEHLKEGLNG